MVILYDHVDTIDSGWSLYDGVRSTRSAALGVRSYQLRHTPATQLTRFLPYCLLESHCIYHVGVVLPPPTSSELWVGLWGIWIFNLSALEVPAESGPSCGSGSPRHVNKQSSTITRQANGRLFKQGTGIDSAKSLKPLPSSRLSYVSTPWPQP